MNCKIGSRFLIEDKIIGGAALVLPLVVSLSAFQHSPISIKWSYANLQSIFYTYHLRIQSRAFYHLNFQVRYNIQDNGENHPI